MICRHFGDFFYMFVSYLSVKFWCKTILGMYFYQILSLFIDAIIITLLLYFLSFFTYLLLEVRYLIYIQRERAFANFNIIHILFLFLLLRKYYSNNFMPLDLKKSEIEIEVFLDNTFTSTVNVNFFLKFRILYCSLNEYKVHTIWNY